MLLCGQSHGQACWDTRAVRHNCEVKKTNAICMTEIIAQCQVPPHTHFSLSLSPTLSQTISLSSLPLALLPFCLTFHQPTRSKIRLPTPSVKPDSETWQSWKPINSNSISKTHKRSLTYAARGVCLAPSVLWSTRGPFKRIRKGTYSVCWPSPSKQKGPVLHRRGSPSEACMHPGWWHRRVGGDPCPEPPYSQTCCVPVAYPPPNTSRHQKKQ